MVKPVIGLNGDVTEEAPSQRKRLALLQSYADAVAVAGGLPVVLPPTADPAHVDAQLDILGGLVLTGGVDYDPELYGQAPHKETKRLHPARQAYDVMLAKAAIRRNLPILAICGGLQVVNIACGGDLIQHLPDKIETGGIHSGHPEAGAHEVIVEAGTRLAQIVGRTKLGVNSTHHQAAGRIGAGLRVSARSTDGVIEGLESVGNAFLVCVQWHPERLMDAAEQAALFRALVDASRPSH